MYKIYFRIFWNLNIVQNKNVYPIQKQAKVVFYPKKIK